jgi:diguanylate cyclase (GGDEF)-like protein
MPAPAATLLIASAALAVVTTCFTAFGLRQPRYSGWGWWVLALWLGTLGAGLGGLVQTPAGAMLSTPLLLQWPVLALVGLRRFHPRQALPGGERGDWAVLAAAVALAEVALLTQGEVAGGAEWVLGACFVVVHLYAAALIFMGPGDADATPVLGLGAAMALAAFAPGLAALAAAPTQAPGPLRTAAATLGLVVLAFVALTLVCERTERQLRDSRRRLRVLANLDTLTQVPNRRHFRELADQALTQDDPGSSVLVLFDVDHFKQINDLLGHAAGDRALCLVSGSVLEHLRAHDVPGRHGGDEFVLLLRHTTTAQAMGVAARIVAEVQRRAPTMELPRLSLSFGLVQVGLCEDISTALRRADQALYEAKRQGRSRAVAALGDEREPVFSESQRLGLTAA